MWYAQDFLPKTFSPTFFFFSIEKIEKFWPHPTARGTLVSQPRMDPVPPALEGRGLNHWTARKVPDFFLIENIFDLLCCVKVYSKMIQLYIIYIISHILSHYGLLHGIEYSSLCHTVDPVVYYCL